MWPGQLLRSLSEGGSPWCVLLGSAVPLIPVSSSCGASPTPVLLPSPPCLPLCPSPDPFPSPSPCQERRQGEGGDGSKQDRGTPALSLCSPLPQGPARPALDWG